VLLLGAQLWKGGKQGRIAVVALIAGIAFSDQLNSSFAKFILERPRPCHVLQGIHLLVSCGGGYSFPSSHAVNNFCGAVVLSHFSEKATPWVFSFALIVSFSRIYVGVHYPSDVLGGAIVGTFCGVFVIAVVAWCQRLLAARMK
jgi:undecaprenyl-diphosphatase